MMKLLQSPWFLAALALGSNIAATAGVFFVHLEELRPSPEEEAVDKWVYSIPFEFNSAGIAEMVQDLHDSKLQLAAREAALGEVEARVQAEKRELKRIREEIVREREAFTSEVVAIEESEAKNLKILATTYANLSPESAVEVFKEMEDDFVAKLLSLMKPDVVSPLFEEMTGTGQTERVSRLTEILRNFKQTPPPEKK